MSKAEHTRILGPDGQPAIIGRIVPVSAGQPERPRWEHDADNPTHKSFARYCAWRRTKCRLRNLQDQFQLLEELDESIHQFVGEVAELGELLLTETTDCFTQGEARAKLIDEIGDVYFCGLWVLDAFGFNPFCADPSITPDTIQSEEELDAVADIATLIRECDRSLPLPDEAHQVILLASSSISWQMCVLSGLLCNIYKKIRWQQRPQDRQVAVQRAAGVLCQAAHLLAMAGATVEDALARNVEKLDARFPDGYVGPGGGIRQGKGA